MVAEDRISSSIEVYRELASSSDSLSEWVRERGTSDLFREPDRSVQIVFQTIANFVNENYDPSQASSFLSGADPWIIAHAAAPGGTVVTLEVRVGATSAKVKIPNICDHFHVRCVNTYEMLRELGASLGG